MNKTRNKLPNMYELKLFEHREFRHNENGYLKGHIYRVPGGWVMTICDVTSAVFIPYITDARDE